MKLVNQQKKKSIQSKILSDKEIIQLVSTVRGDSKTIALCHGVFDLLHPGHFQHFKEASKLADCLIVSVTSDKFVNKGPGRPLFDEQIRTEVLATLEVVDYVVISDQPTAEEVLNLIKPDYYVKGPDYSNSRADVTGMIDKEKEIVAKYGGTIYFTSGITSSSSLLINKFFAPVSGETQNWIDIFKKTNGYVEVVDSLKEISKLTALVLGETIIDQYTFCSPLAKSSKDPILAFQQHETSLYPGGVLAIAHLGNNLIAKTKIISFSAPNDPLLKSLENQMDSNIEYEFIPTTDRPTILKHRYVERGSNTRVFEYYNFSDLELPVKVTDSILNSILDSIGNYDIVVAADYGHSFFSKSVISLIQTKSHFLSINTQANAGNRGYNTISKYSKVDLISINGGELQLELRDRNPDYIQIVPKIMKEKNASYAVVTLGADGLLIFDSNCNYEKVPAFATNVVDKVGAGDSVFIMASLLAKVNAPLKVIGFISNIVAAHEVSQLGHQKSLSSSDILKHTQAILK